MSSPLEIYGFWARIAEKYPQFKETCEWMSNYEREKLQNESYLTYIALPSLEKRFPASRLRSLCIEEFKAMQVRMAEMEAGLYRQNDEMRAKGIPYVKRTETLKKKYLMIAEYKVHLKELLEGKFEIVPLSQWLTGDDVEKMKKEGFTAFFKKWGITYKMGYIANTAWQKKINQHLQEKREQELAEKEVQKSRSFSQAIDTSLSLMSAEEPSQKQSLTQDGNSSRDIMSSADLSESTLQTAQV